MCTPAGFISTVPQQSSGFLPTEGSMKGDVAQLTGNIEKLAGRGVKGGLRISRNQKSGRGDSGTWDCHGRVVSTAQCWSRGQIRELRGLRREGVELRTQYFDFVNWCLVPLTIFWHQGALLHYKVTQEIQLIRALHHHNLFPKCRARPAARCHGTL